MKSNSSDKRIICLIEDLGPGGAERQLAYLAMGLRKCGHEVQVWTYYPGDFFLPLLQDSGVVYRFLPEARNRVKRIMVLRRAIKEFNPDVLISYLDTACVVSCVIRLLGVRYKLIVSERNTTQSISLRDRIKFFCYSFADWIVPNSETQGAFLYEHYPKLSRKIRVITNYVDTDKFHPGVYNPSNSILNVIVVARVMPQKNPLSLIYALKLLTGKGISIHVDWFGNTYDEKYKQSCLDLIEKLGLEDVICFKDASQDIYSLYSNYDVFCLPSVYEGFSNVICEAMSCGLPIVCGDVADNARIVKEGENAVVFNPHEITSIAEALESFYNLEPETKASYSKKSRDISVSKFSFNTFINKYLDIIN